MHCLHPKTAGATVAFPTLALLGLALAGPLWPQAAPAKTDPAAAQPAGSQQVAGPPPATPNWPPAGPTPRTADGKPDLSGAWAPNAIRQNVDLVGTGVVVPFQPWAEKVYKDHKDNISRDDPEARCFTTWGAADEHHALPLPHYANSWPHSDCL